LTNVEWVLPTALERLKAEDVTMATDFRELAITVEWFAAAIIDVLVQLGPKQCGTCKPGKCCGAYYDPCEDEGRTPEADAYCRLARAVGVL